MCADLSPRRSAKDLDADFKDYVLHDHGPTTLGVVGGLTALELEPDGETSRGRRRARTILLPRWLGPFEGLRRGARVRVYGGAEGWPIRGLDIAGTEVFYSPLEETAEGWCRSLTSRQGYEDEVLYRYTPTRWRTFLPGAPMEVSVTRTNLTVRVRGTTSEDVFPLHDYLCTDTVGARPALWLAVGVYATLLAVLTIFRPETFAFSVALFSGWLLGSFLSRSEALYVSGRGELRYKRYPLLGRDRSLEELTRTIKRYHTASEKRYWREKVGLPPR